MPQPNAEALLENAGWIRALCRSLVRDPHRAEDAAQETLVRALQSGPSEPRALRQWLRTVARNAVFQRGRQDAARRIREERTESRSPAVPTPAEALQKASMRRRIVEAVLELEEPYRTTVVLRYFEELSTEDVAAARGIAPSTVRSQTQRAMAQLRTKLQAEFDEEEVGMSFGALLLAMASDPPVPVPLAPGPAGSAGGASTGSGALGGTAGLSAGTFALVQAAGLTAVALGGMWWLLGDTGDVEAGRGPHGRRQALAIAGRPDRSAQEIGSRTTPAADRPERLTSLLILDAASEAALEGVEVQATFFRPDPSGRLLPHTLGLGSTPHGGHLLLRLPEDARAIATAQTELLLTHPGFFPRRLSPEELFGTPEGSVLQVGMLATGSLDLTLVDADQNPLPGLSVRATPRIDAIFGTGASLAQEALFDGIGLASLTSLPTGVPIDIEVSADGGEDGFHFLHATARIDPLAHRSRLLLSAPPSGDLLGTLVSPGEQPLQGVSVSFSGPPIPLDPGQNQAPPRSTITAEDGSFRFPRARAGRGTLQIAGWGDPIELDVTAGARNDLGLLVRADLSHLEGTLLWGGDPAPAPGGAPEHPILHAFRGGRAIASTPIGRDGGFDLALPPGELRLVVTDGPWEEHRILANLSAAAPATGLSIPLELPTEEAPAPADEVASVASASSPSVLVVDASGSPVARAVVTLVLSTGERETPLRYLTDESGRVELLTSGAGGVPIRIEAERLGVGIAAPVLLGSGSTAVSTGEPEAASAAETSRRSTHPTGELQLRLLPHASLRLRLEGEAAPDPSETARLIFGSTSRQRFVVPGALGNLGLGGVERVRVLRHLAPGPVTLVWGGSSTTIDLAPGEERELTLPTDRAELLLELNQGDAAGSMYPAFTLGTLIPLDDPSAPSLEAAYGGPGTLRARRHPGASLLLLSTGPGALPLAFEVEVPKRGPLAVSLSSEALGIDRPSPGPDLHVLLVSLDKGPLPSSVELATRHGATGPQIIPAVPSGATLRIDGVNGSAWISIQAFVPNRRPATIHWP